MAGKKEFKSSYCTLFHTASIIKIKIQFGFHKKLENKHLFYWVFLTNCIFLFSLYNKINLQSMKSRFAKTIKAQDAVNSKAGFRRLAILKIGL